MSFDAARHPHRRFNPLTNGFLSIPDNVQFIAAVNRGAEFSGTFGIDAAQLDRFAPLQMDYLPPEEEVKLLLERHPELDDEDSGIFGFAYEAQLGPDLPAEPTDERLDAIVTEVRTRRFG